MDRNGSLIILTLTAMTFIDPVTGWFKIAEVPVNDKSSAGVSQLFNYTWIYAYTRDLSKSGLITVQNSNVISYRYWITLQSKLSQPQLKGHNPTQ